MSERHRIVAIHAVEIETTYGRFVGARSGGQPYGLYQQEWLVQLKTDSGLTGVTNARPAIHGGSPEELQALLSKLLGRDVFDFYRVSGGRVTGVSPRWSELLRLNGFLSYALFDLIGHAQGVPVYKLLGDRVRDRVDVYDTTMNFQDMVRPDEGAEAVARDAKETTQRGYRAVKLTVGRGLQALEAKAGLARDIEAVLRTREAVGPEVKIMVDANNAYSHMLPLLESFVRETASANLFWMEEMITQDLEGYRTLKEWRDRYAPQTLLADGEASDGRPTIYWEMMEEGLLDVFQPDMLALGFWPYHTLAQDMAEAGYDVRIAPHNNRHAALGLRGVIQFGVATPSVLIAEDPTLKFDVYDTPGYRFENGAYSVPESPGLGVEIDQDLYARRYASSEAVLRE